MATPALRCERHGELTRLSCVECGKPICPKCAVRTEVGLKCEADAKAVEVPGAALEVLAPRSRTPLYLGAAGAAVAFLLIAVVLLTRDEGGGAPEPALPPVGSWAEAPSLSTIRGTTTAVNLPDGRVLVSGGGVGAIPISSAEIFEPATNSWVQTGSLNRARRGHQAAVLPDGRVLVAGGRSEEGEPIASVELYDPASRTWAEVAPMSLGRIGHSMTTLADGRVLVAGGTAKGESGAGGGQTIRPDETAEVFDPATRTWRRTNSMTTPRFEHTATLLADGKVLIVGGQGPADGGRLTALATAELYDPAADGFITSSPLSEGRANHAAVLLPSQTVVVSGGAGGPNADVALASVEIYDARTGRWARAEPLAQARTGHALTLLADGRALATGGELAQRGTRRSLTRAELFDPKLGKWRSAGDMKCPRSEHAAVLLGDGTVLVMAGDAASPGQLPLAQACVDRYKP